MTLPSAAEILAIGFDEMIPLPIHHRIRLSMIFREEFMHSDKYSDEGLLSRTSAQLYAVVTDFKQHFDTYFSIVSDSNLNVFEEEVSNAASYLFVQPIEFRMFLSGHRELDDIVSSIIDRHQALIDITVMILDRTYCTTEVQAALAVIGVSDPGYLWWASSLVPSLRDYILTALNSCFDL